MQREFFRLPGKMHVVLESPDEAQPAVHVMYNDTSEDFVLRQLTVVLKTRTMLRLVSDPSGHSYTSPLVNDPNKDSHTSCLVTKNRSKEWIFIFAIYQYGIHLNFEWISQFHKLKYKHVGGRLDDTHIIFVYTREETDYHFHSFHEELIVAPRIFFFFPAQCKTPTATVLGHAGQTDR